MDSDLSWNKGELIGCEKESVRTPGIGMGGEVGSENGNSMVSPSMGQVDLERETGGTEM
jgi:hypothetical protein